MWAKVSAVIGAIKAIASILDFLKEAWNKIQDKKIDKHYEKKKERRKRLVKQISKEQNDEKLKELHRKLRNLDNS